MVAVFFKLRSQYIINISADRTVKFNVALISFVYKRS